LVIRDEEEKRKRQEDKLQKEKITRREGAGEVNEPRPIHAAFAF
jgi:hypothetical protein